MGICLHLGSGTLLAETAREVTQRWEARVSAFSNPFSNTVRFFKGCICGRHTSAAEHDQATLIAADAAGPDKRRQVVTGASSRRRYGRSSHRCSPPRLPQRRRLDRRARRNLFASSARTPLPTPSRRVRAAREEGPQGRLHPDHLRHADHHGAPDGLLCQARPQRRSDQDRRLGGDPRQDAEQGIRRAHMLSPMPLAISLGVGSNPIPIPSPAIENINGQAITLAHQAQGQARSEALEGLQIRGALRLFDAQLLCCAITWRSMASIPTRDVQIRACRRRRWSPICAPTISMASLAPDPVNQRAVYDGVGFIHILSKEIWDGHPCCAFAAPAGIRHHDAEHLSRRC